MKSTSMAFLAALAALLPRLACADDLSLKSAPPVVVHTVPEAGATGVDAGLKELQVTFSKPMQDGSWSWSTWGEDRFPETTGKPYYLPDGRTCVLPVRLQPGKLYATWLNSEKFHGFQDRDFQPAAPYLLTFETAGAEAAEANPQPPALLNADQRLVFTWTEREFRGLLETGRFAEAPGEERTVVENKLFEALKAGPSSEYYRAINALAALREPKAVTPLLAIAADRHEKDNRDRWMAVRALGLLNDRKVAPELIHLLYHYNANTRWWAQISLVRLTGVNFGKDWRGWGKWWNEHGGQPAFTPEFIRWIEDPAWSDPLTIAKSVAAADDEFLNQIRNQ